MGRKLNALEEFQAAPGELGADQQGGRAKHELLKRIADQLGITVEQLDRPPAPSIAVQPALASKRQSEFDLTQQCVDLIEAFIRIQDPQDRLRCLKIVRDAALAKSPETKR